MALLRTIRTVRHLRAEQLLGQVRNRLRPYWESPERVAQQPAPPFPGSALPPGVVLRAPGAQANEAGALLAGNFAFVGETNTLGWPPANWNLPGIAKLWQYNVHYFEWIWALDYTAARTVALDWIDRHPLTRGQVGWEPYPTSLRLMNWCAVFFGRYREKTLADTAFLEQLWPSIATQGRWLEKHLEFHLLGNHLLENGAALAFLGSCFPADNDLVSGWRRQGRAILHRELPEQILPDGMHFERSPMYHSRITYLLELLHATPFREEFAEPLNRMRSALADLCHPDGEISLFNDSAFGIYNAPADLLGEHRPREGAWALPDAGYYGWRDPDGNYLVCDAGPIGPDYIPGHAHADTFSYELSLRGHRVIVDSGVYDYVPSGMRAYCRSTRAHNTVEVGGADQCELWGAFRVARRGYPKEVNWQPTEDGFRLRGWHTGYQRLPERAVHRREFCWEQAEPRLTVTDRIRARRAVNSVSWVHLHPSCEVTDSVDNTVTIAFPGGTFTIQFSGKGELSREESVYCPEFGRKEQRVALAFRSHSPQSETSYSVLLK